MNNTSKTVRCGECGEVKGLDLFDEATQAKLIFSARCFECEFWYKLFILKDDPRMLRIDGKHFYMGEQLVHTPQGWTGSGFGGLEFEIQRFDLEHPQRIKNLNFNGIIPRHFKERLPDNACFV